MDCVGIAQEARSPGRFMQRAERISRVAEPSVPTSPLPYPPSHAGEGKEGVGHGAQECAFATLQS